MQPSRARRDYGLLSVHCQLLASARKLFDVPPSAFRPPPKVWSSVVLLEPHARAAGLGIRDIPHFLDFAAHCFRFKRKTLRNNLADRYEKHVLDAQPEAALRAEQLSLEQMASLYLRLSGEGIAE